MFLIMGINQAEKKLNFNQLVVCKSCGKYGRVEVFMTYTYFMLFFIPIFKWDKRFFVRMNCCGTSCEISKELGKEVESGKLKEINIEELNFRQKEIWGRACLNCGFVTNEDFSYCPKCGSRLD